MITKIVFTILIILLVGMLFSKQRAQSKTSQPSAAAEATRRSLSPRNLAYGLIGLLMIFSMGLYYLDRSEAKQVITVNVIDAAGVKTQYQVYRKDLDRRAFTTIDRNRVQLAQTDRLEIMGQ